MTQLFNLIECFLILMSIYSFIKWIFRKDLIYIIISISTLSMFFAIKCLLNDQLMLGISLLGISLILGWLCEYDIKKNIYEKE
ncbi:hypothetical protein NRS6096_22300 (plasmid) [Bacillus subtilis]|nr:hypothetical protein NRS6096_22300 [Bacillus subtilis]